MWNFSSFEAQQDIHSVPSPVSHGGSACYPGILEAEAGGLLKVRGQPGYTVRSYLKITKH